MHSPYLKIGTGLILGIATAYVLSTLVNPFPTPKTHTHGTGDEVHVHADFLFYIHDEQIDLRKDKYQSVAGNPQHASIHLHDNIGHVIHRHAEDVTLADFLSSIGFSLTDSCITTDTGEEYCTNTDASLALIVNGEHHDSPSSYILEDGDRTLLYYGDPDNPAISEYVASITDEACIYSGTCPERGTPPPEACGMTCEI